MSVFTVLAVFIVLGFLGGCVAYSDLEVTTTYCTNGYHRIEQIGLSQGSFNQGFGGKFVYLCAKTDPAALQITELQSIQTWDRTEDCGPLTEDGFARIRQVGGSNGDFNQDNGRRPWIYLCYKKDIAGPSEVVDVAVWSGHNSNGGHCPQPYSTVSSWDGEPDFAKGTGSGYWIYICYKTAPYSGFISSTVQNMHYPTLGSLPTVPLTSVVTHVYCNAMSSSAVMSGMEETQTITEGTSSCFTWSSEQTNGLKLTATASMKGEIPLVEEVSASLSTETSWTSTYKSSGENCQNSQHTSTRTIVFPSRTLPAHTRVMYQYVQYQGELSDLPFTAQVVVAFANGSRQTFNVSGSYVGTSYSSIHEGLDSEATNVTSCFSSGLAQVHSEGQLIGI